MRKFTFFNLFLIVSLVVTFNSIAQTAVAPSGTGTACDPYQISSLDNLYWMTQTSASWAAGKYFIQTANIDAAATSTYFSNGSGGYYGLPVIAGNSQAVGNQVQGTFSANYNGQGFTISNLYINRNIHQVALFGYSLNSVIKNLTLTNPTVVVNNGVSGNYQGNAIFIASGSGTFDNIKIIGGTLTNNTQYGYSGGMFGRVQSITANNCSVNATITLNGALNFNGGFIGFTELSTGTITNCNSSGSISTNSGSNGIGGFVGGANATNYTFQKCYSSMNVNGSIASSNNLGGFIGAIYNGLLISNCYATGNIISSGTNAGGFFGTTNTNGTSVISNCYAKGSVTGNSSGGFGGTRNTGTTITNCFWDTQTSGKSNATSSGVLTEVIGKTTLQMYSATTYSDASWNLNTIWTINNLTYPTLMFPTPIVVNGFISGVANSNQVVCSNSTASDIVLTDYSGTIQWQSSLDNATWTDVSGATSATLTSAQIGTLTFSKFIRAVVTNGSCVNNSNVVSVKVNNGLSFDGAGDFVSVGNHSALNFTGNFTIEAWVNVPASPKYSINTIFSKNYPNHGTPGYSFGFNHWNTTNLFLVLEDGLGAISSNTPLTAGAWSHVAIVVSGNGTLGTFYINGKEVGSSAVTLTNASAVNEFIGSMDASGNYSLSGTLDELRIWNLARTQQELIDNLDNPLIGIETGLVAYYDFNQGIPGGTNTGLNVKDQTSNNFNGTVNGISLTGSSSNFVDGNHLSVIAPESSICLTATSPKLKYGGTGKTPLSYQWYSNTSASTIGSTLISGSTINTYDAPTSIAGTSYYYLNAIGTCASSSNSNFAKVIIQNAQNGAISGGDYLYVGHTGNYTTTETAATSNPWVISNTISATTTSTGVVTALVAGTPTLTFTSSLGCVSTKTINVVPVEWVGTTSTDWTIASNWNGGYVPTNFSTLGVNANATSDLVLNGSKTITTLNFNGANKKVDLGSYSLTASTINGANATNYIKTSGNGSLVMTLANNVSKVYPIGKTAYNPVTITNKSGASDVFSARVLDGAYMEGLTGAAITSTVLNRTWDISKTNANAGSGVDFVFNWNTGEVANGSFTAPKMNHFSSTTSNWEVPTVTSNTFGSNALTVVGYTGTFSPFTIAEGSSALPVELTTFNTTCTEVGTTINWETASEHQSAYFDVEKSRDGANWTTIETVSAAGNSTTTLAYSIVDAEKGTDVVYYRLNQVDQNGTHKIYGPISAICIEIKDFTAEVYPNPTKDDFTLEITNSTSQYIQLQIIGNDGIVMYQATRLLDTGTTILPMNNEQLKAGVYTLQIKGENTLKTIKLLVF